MPPWRKCATGPSVMSPTISVTGTVPAPSTMVCTNIRTIILQLVDQRYLPEGLERGCFYHPSERGWEAYRVDAAARDRAQAVHAAARDRAQAPHAAAGVHHGVELPKARSVDVEANGVRSGRKKPGARDASEGEEAGAR